MKLIFVSGKYMASTKSSIQDNIAKAAKLSIELFDRGWNVYTPHKNTGGYEMLEIIKPEWNQEFWYTICIDVLKRCDAVIMMKNWINSEGAKLEHRFAYENKIPIYYEEKGLPFAKEIK